jgi:hypothetical protein
MVWRDNSNKKNDDNNGDHDDNSEEDNNKITMVIKIKMMMINIISKLLFIKYFKKFYELQIFFR